MYEIISIKNKKYLVQNWKRKYKKKFLIYIYMYLLQLLLYYHLYVSFIIYNQFIF